MIKDAPWLFIGLFLGALAGCLALAWLGRKQDPALKNQHLQETSSTPPQAASLNHPVYSMAQWKECLGLTDSQDAKFQDAMKSHEDMMTSILKQMAKATVKLTIDTIAKSSHDVVATDQASLKALSEPLIKEQAQFIKRVNSFLTPAQQAEFARLRAGENLGDMLMCHAK